MDLSALNFGNSLVYKRFEFNLNAKPRILMEKSATSSTDGKHQDTNEKASVDEKREYEKVFNARVSDEVKRAEAGMTTIYFRDPITQKLTRSALSGESLSILGREFGTDDMKKRADGSYILSGKAENFVAGWYADIAYTRGYLKADKDSNGYFTEQELKNVRSGYVAQVLQNGDTGEIAMDASFVESYIKLDGEYSNALFTKFAFKDTVVSSQRDFGSATIGIELDKTIKNDKNLDGKITFDEVGGENLQPQVLKASGDLFEEIRLMYKVLKEPLEKGAENTEMVLIFDEKTTDMWLKNALDKLANGVKFEDLADSEYILLMLHLKDELFDEKLDETGHTYLEFNEEKFKNFYAEFKESFKQRSAEFLGLSKEDASKLDYDQLSKIVDEMYATFKNANATSISTIGDTINLRNSEFILEA